MTDPLTLSELVPAQTLAKDMLEEIQTIVLPAGEYEINGETRQVEHKFAITTSPALAKALLEAEEALRGLYITYQDDMSAAGTYTKKRVLFVKSGQALAQIQRITRRGRCDG